LLAQASDAHAKLLQNGNDDSLVLIQQGEEEVKIVDDRIARAPAADTPRERFADLTVSVRS
jgi:hypothetical protein